jgi:hypothetical protein
MKVGEYSEVLGAVVVDEVSLFLVYVPMHFHLIENLFSGVQTTLTPARRP